MFEGWEISRLNDEAYLFGLRDGTQAVVEKLMETMRESNKETMSLSDLDALLRSLKNRVNPNILYPSEEAREYEKKPVYQRTYSEGVLEGSRQIVEVTCRRILPAISDNPSISAFELGCIMEDIEFDMGHPDMTDTPYTEGIADGAKRTLQKLSTIFRSFGGGDMDVPAAKVFSVLTAFKKNPVGDGDFTEKTYDFTSKVVKKISDKLSEFRLLGIPDLISLHIDNNDPWGKDREYWRNVR